MQAEEDSERKKGEEKRHVFKSPHARMTLREKNGERDKDTRRQKR